MEVQVENKSKKEILSVAKSLFWKHGIRRVTVQEICKEAKMSKMTFYRHFENKDDVAFQIIQKAQLDSHKIYREIMDDSCDFATKVVRLIKLKRDDVSGISQELVKDIFENQDEKLQELIKNSKEEFLVEIIKDFSNAQKKGQIRKDLKLEFILYSINDIDRKLKDEYLQNLYNSEEDLIMELTNFFFYGIMP